MSARTPQVEQILDELIGIEGDGGGRIDPSDSGGATRWGITEAVARELGYTGAMSDLPRDTAEVFYLRKYFVGPGFDQVLLRDRDLAAELFEIEVNLPPGRAVGFLQRALNSLNDPKGDGKLDYPELMIDGQLGARSFAALDTFLKRRKKEGVQALLLLLNSQQAVYYLGRTEARAKNKRYVFGWVIKRVKLAWAA